MGKLINADVFDSILQDAQAECKKNGGNFRFGVLSSVRANLANQPAVDVAPVVHGRWEGYNVDYTDWQRTDGTPIFILCCVCHNVVLNNGSASWNYCPNCGAKMDGENAEINECDSREKEGGVEMK